MAVNNKSSLFVIDASFVASVLLPDELTLANSDKNALLLADRSLTFIAPKLLFFEFGNALKSAVKRKRIESKDCPDLIERFEAIPIETTNVSMDKVVSFAILHGLSFYDASYAWLAYTRKASLLTFDKKLKRIFDSLFTH